MCSLACNVWFDVHSAQLGLEEIVEVICALSDFNVILEDVSRRRNSWRLEGGSVKRRGSDMVAIVIAWSWWSLARQFHSIRGPQPTVGVYLVANAVCMCICSQERARELSSRYTSKRRLQVSQTWRVLHGLRCTSSAPAVGRVARRGLTGVCLPRFRLDWIFLSWVQREL